jgi:hypothetical protein
MISLIQVKFSVGILIVALSCGSVLVFWHDQIWSKSIGEKHPNIEASQIHTASWYVSHRNVLKQDELRCSGDAGNISQAECQNAASADEQLTQIDMKNAASENDVLSTSHGKAAN